MSRTIKKPYRKSRAFDKAGGIIMNERATIAKIKMWHSIPEGSKPIQATEKQLRTARIIGRLLLHAHKRGKRLKGKWL